MPILKTFYKNIDFLSEGKRGNAYFIHLFVPHSPYIFDEKCSIRFPKEWRSLNPFNREGHYQDYLKQVKCSHKMMDDLLSKLNSRSTNSNGTIIIQGDHGSRINFLGRKDPFTTGQYIQDFSTFFAVRSQKHNSGYDRRPIALDELTRSVIFGMKPLPEIDQSKFVCLTEFRSRVCNRQPLPPFAHGEPINEW